MTDYQKYIKALRKCAKEHDNDRTFTGHIIVSDLCRDTANLLETIEQEPRKIPNVRVNHMEDWAVNLFKAIEQAANDGREFNLSIDAEEVQNLAFEIRSLEWIEIY